MNTDEAFEQYWQDVEVGNWGSKDWDEELKAVARRAFEAGVAYKPETDGGIL